MAIAQEHTIGLLRVVGKLDYSPLELPPARG
jgi:hypothetical protein